MDKLMTALKSAQKKRKPAGPRKILTCLQYFATVEFLKSDRLVNRVIKNAGLGITNTGVKEKFTITYAPGEVVDEARVMMALESMIKQLDDAKDPLQLSNPKVISIYSKTVPATH